MKEIFEDDFSLPKDNQQIVKIISSRGNNLHEVETSLEPEEKFLVSMPTKFRKNVWIKRGDYVIVEPIEEGDKVKAEIVRILTPEHIKIFTNDGIWPKKFTKKRQIEDLENLDDNDLVKNTNRRFHNDDESEDDTSDSD